VGFDQVFDHGLSHKCAHYPKGSLQLVGEFFEVRAQVDRDLTTASRVDRLLRLIKNLGHHREDII
jgi:hypothetical protein